MMDGPRSLTAKCRTCEVVEVAKVICLGFCLTGVSENEMSTNLKSIKYYILTYVFHVL